MATDTPPEGFAQAFRRQVTFRISSEDAPLLEAAAGAHGGIQAGILAVLRSYVAQRLQASLPDPPTEERLIGNAQALAHLRDRLPLSLQPLGLSQLGHDLLHAVALARHPSPPFRLSYPTRTTFRVDQIEGGRTVAIPDPEPATSE